MSNFIRLYSFYKVWSSEIMIITYIFLLVCFAIIIAKIIIFITFNSGYTINALYNYAQWVDYSWYYLMGYINNGTQQYVYLEKILVQIFKYGVSSILEILLSTAMHWIILSPQFITCLMIVEIIYILLQ